MIFDLVVSNLLSDRRFRFILFVCLISLTTACSIHKNNHSPPVPGRSEISMEETLVHFTNYAEQIRKDWKIPGMAIAIVKNEKIIYAKGFGERTTQNAPVTPHTIFDIASLTKSFTAALLAVQIDEGKYSWSTNVSKVYPKFELYDHNVTKEFEVRDLIAHNSGLPADAEGALGNFGYSIEHTIYALRYIKPVTSFRKSFAYQGIFLEVAKEIIQNVSNESYTDNLRKKIFDPLQMNNSYLRTEQGLNKLNDVAQPFLYYEHKNYAYPKDFPYLSQTWALKPGVAGGGIKSSALDMGKWLIFNMNNGAIGNTQLISAKNMNFIHSLQTVIKTSKNGDIEQAYGEGWFIDKQEYKPYTVLYHPGGGTGMHALMAYIPEEKIGIVILTNQYSNKVPEALYKRLFDLYFNKTVMKDWSKIYLQEREKMVADEELASKTDECQRIKNLNLKKYVGAYYNPVYKKLVITKQGDYLSLSIGPLPILWELTPCKDNIFQAYWPNPGGMDIPMLSRGQNLVKFLEGKNKEIHKMIIPFLNDDGCGVFVKE